MVDLKRCWNPFCTNGACDGTHHTGMAGEHWDEPAPVKASNNARVLATVKHRADTRRDWQVVNPALNMPHPDVLRPLASLLNYLHADQPAGHYQLWADQTLEIEGVWHQGQQSFMVIDELFHQDAEAGHDFEAGAGDPELCDVCSEPSGARIHTMLADEDAAQAEQDRQIALAEERSDSMEYGLDA
jgi:hypothetical protein